MLKCNPISGETVPLSRGFLWRQPYTPHLPHFFHLILGRIFSHVYAVSLITLQPYDRFVWFFHIQCNTARVTTLTHKLLRINCGKITINVSATILDLGSCVSLPHSSYCKSAVVTELEFSDNLMPYCYRPYFKLWSRKKLTKMNKNLI